MSRKMTTLDLEPMMWAKFEITLAQKEMKNLKEGIKSNKNMKINIFDILLNKYLNGKIHINIQNEPLPENIIRKAIVIKPETIKWLNKHREILKEKATDNEKKKIKNRNIIIGLMRYYINEK